MIQNRKHSIVKIYLGGIKILLSDIIKIKWNNGNKKWFEKAGYTFTNYGDEFLVNVNDLTKYSKYRVSVMCDYCEQTYETTYASYYKSSNTGLNACPHCAGKKSKDISYNKRANDAFGSLIKICNDNNYVLLTSIDEFTNYNMKIRYLCPRHGLQTSILQNLLYGHRCIDCSYEERGIDKRYTINEVIEKINSINNNTIINPEEYENVFKSNLKIKCNCGRIFQTSLSNYKKQNCCSFCSQSVSRGEREIKDYLDNHKIIYNQQFRFIDCKDKKPLPFDFYLPEYNLCIEYDGEQHYMPIWGQDQLLITQKHDQIKNQYCKDNKIVLLRIPYYQKSIIGKIISNVLKAIE